MMTDFISSDTSWVYFNDNNRVHALRFEPGLFPTTIDESIFLDNSRVHFPRCWLCLFSTTIAKTILYNDSREYFLRWQSTPFSYDSKSYTTRLSIFQHHID